MDDMIKDYLAKGGSVTVLPPAPAMKSKRAKRRGNWKAAKALRGGHGRLS